MIILKLKRKLSSDKAKVNKQDKEMHLLSIFRRGGLYIQNPNDIILRRAYSIKDLYKAYALVHDQYTINKYIHPHTLGIRVRSFELSENIATFIVKKQDKIIGVCSLIIDSKELGLPCDKIYSDELKKNRNNSRLLCEATNEALHKDFYSSTALTELLRCVLSHALYKNCDKMIIEVSKGHKRFYELNYFTQIGTTHNYSDELYAPVILMSCDLIKLVATFNSADENSDCVDSFMKKYYYTQNPYLSYVKKWDSNKEKQIKNTFKLVELLQSRYNNMEYYIKSMRQKLFSIAFTTLCKR